MSRVQKELVLKGYDARDDDYDDGVKIRQIYQRTIDGKKVPRGGGGGGAARGAGGGVKRGSTSRKLAEFF